MIIWLWIRFRIVLLQDLVLTTEGPSWGYLRCVLGAIGALLLFFWPRSAPVSWNMFNFFLNTPAKGLARDWWGVHTVEYDPFITSHLAPPNSLQGLTWCKFGHVTLKIWDKKRFKDYFIVFTSVVWSVRVLHSHCRAKKEQRLKIKDLFLRAKARTWPWLSYVCHIRSTAAVHMCERARGACEGPDIPLRTLSPSPGQNKPA